MIDTPCQTDVRRTLTPRSPSKWFELHEPKPVEDGWCYLSTSLPLICCLLSAVPTHKDTHTAAQRGCVLTHHLSCTSARSAPLYTRFTEGGHTHHSPDSRFTDLGCSYITFDFHNNTCTCPHTRAHRSPSSNWIENRCPPHILHSSTIQKWFDLNGFVGFGATLYERRVRVEMCVCVNTEALDSAQHAGGAAQTCTLLKPHFPPLHNPITECQVNVGISRSYNTLSLQSLPVAALCAAAPALFGWRIEQHWWLCSHWRSGAVPKKNRWQKIIRWPISTQTMQG